MRRPATANIRLKEEPQLYIPPQPSVPERRGLPSTPQPRELLRASRAKSVGSLELAGRYAHRLSQRRRSRNPEREAGVSVDGDRLFNQRSPSAVERQSLSGR